MPLQTANQFQLTPDIIGSLSRGGQIGQQFQQIRQQPQIQELRQRALAGDPQAIQELAAIQPEAAQQVQTFQQNRFNLATAEEKQRITSVARAALQVQAIPTPEGKIEFLESRREELAKANIPTGETDEALNLYKEGRIDDANQLVDQMVGIGQATGILQAPVARPSLQAVTPAEGGGFIGIEPTTRESVFIPPPAGRRTKAQVDAQRKTQEKRVKDETEALKTRFDRAQKLRGEIDKASKDFNKIEAAFGRIEAVSAEPSAAGDLALIFNFMKMLDPGSTVREGEFATAQNAAGVPGRVVSLYNRITRGERLNPEQRGDFLTQSENLLDRATRDNKKAVNKIISIGKRFKIDKKDILGEQPKPPKTPPNVGRFKIEVVE